MEQQKFENLLAMEGGLVLNLHDKPFGRFVADAVGVNIHDEKYQKNGTSKANKLRTFWEVEPDHAVGTLLLALVDYASYRNLAQQADECRAIAQRLLASGPRLDHLKGHATAFDAKHLAEQIHRMEAAIHDDPALAIGTAKELIETCCKTILVERGCPIEGTPDIPKLTKATLKELRLVPEGVDEERRGADVIKRLLQTLGTIGNGLAELRGLYGTGHGKDGRASGLTARHAKLATGAAATLATFLFETHLETKAR